LKKNNLWRRVEEGTLVRKFMRQEMPRVPKDRIAVLIGKAGKTRKALQEAAGCAHLNVDSESGTVMVDWGEPGTYDPVKVLKLPDVIKAVGRGMAPSKAIKLLNDDHFFELVDLRDHVGKRSNQLRRIRARIIGTKGKMRRVLEVNTQTEISIYGSTIVLVGREETIGLARQAIERLANGAEHSTVVKLIERERKRMKLESRSLSTIAIRDDVRAPQSGFEDLVPGLADVSDRRGRRLKAAQVDPEDPEEVSEVMILAEDESVSWSEE